jgi:hypothetical protein
MRKYWKTNPKTKPTTESNAASPTVFDDGTVLSEFDRHRLSLIENEEEEGWPAELRRYLKDMPVEVTKHTDVVEWWQVSHRYEFQANL